MSVLVVGAGLIGSQIARCEVERGEDVVIFDVSPKRKALSDILPLARVDIAKGDVIDFGALTRTIKDNEISTIYHTAAYPGFTITSQARPHAAINVNVMGFVNVLECARRWDIRRVILTSSNVLSTYVDPPKDEGKFDREYAYPRPSTVYSSTKLACENFGLNYAGAYGLDFVAVRLAAVFGPWRYPGGGGPTSVIREMVDRSLRGQKFEAAFGNFEYVYSRDAGRGAVLACHSETRRDRIFNIGMGVLFDLHEIADMVRSLVRGADITILDSKKKAGSEPLTERTRSKNDYEKMPPQRFVRPLDLSRSREQIGYEPEFDMRKALIDFVGFLRAL